MKFFRKYSHLFTFGVLTIAMTALLIDQFRDTRAELKDIRSNK